MLSSFGVLYVQWLVCLFGHRALLVHLIIFYSFSLWSCFVYRPSCLLLFGLLLVVFSLELWALVPVLGYCIYLFVSK